MPKPAWTVILLFMLLCVAGMTGAHHQVRPMVEMEVLQIFSRLALNYDISDLYLSSSL
jgi:hypothetical protein